MVKRMFKKLHGIEGEVTAAAIKKVYPAYDSTITWGEVWIWLMNEKFALVPSTAPAMPLASIGGVSTQKTNYQRFNDAIESLDRKYGLTHDDVTVDEQNNLDATIYQNTEVVANLGFNAGGITWYYKIPVFSDICKTYVQRSTHKQNLEDCILGFIETTGIKPIENEQYRLLVEAIKPLEEAQGFTAEGLTTYQNGGCDVNMYKSSILVGSIGYSAVQEMWFFEEAIHSEQLYSLAEPKYYTRINGCITELLNSNAHYRAKSQSTKNHSFIIIECITRAMKLRDYDIQKLQFLRFGNLAEETVKTMYDGKTLGNITYQYKTGEWFFSSDNYELATNYRVTVKGAVADMLNYHAKNS